MMMSQSEISPPAPIEKNDTAIACPSRFCASVSAK